MDLHDNGLDVAEDGEFQGRLAKVGLCQGQQGFSGDAVGLGCGWGHC